MPQRSHSPCFETSHGNGGATSTIARVGPNDVPRAHPSARTAQTLIRGYVERGSCWKNVGSVQTGQLTIVYKPSAEINFRRGVVQPSRATTQTFICRRAQGSA